MYTREKIESIVKSKGYKWFEDNANKSYDVNIVGVRNNAPSVADKVTNVFDDYITISFKDASGNWQFYCWNATTDPGKKCQVFKRVKDFNEFMSICKKAAKIHGNKFSYTLLEL